MTSEQRYKLVFSGQILEGFEATAVQQGLAKALKLGDAQLKTLFSGRLITVRKGLDPAQAEKFRAVFERVGARVHVHVDGGDGAVTEPAPAIAAEPRVQGKLQAVGKQATARVKAAAPAKDAAGIAARASAVSDAAVVTSKPTANSKAKARPATAASGGEGELECPRCAHRQPVSEQCVHCRMDLRRHLRRLERRAKLRERRRQAGVG